MTTRQSITRQSILWWGAGGVLLLFAVTGLVGALVKSDRPQGSWRVEVVSAAITADRPPLQRADPANRWLVVQVKVENLGDSSAAVEPILRLSGVDGLVSQEPGVVVLRDSSRADRLHPGMPEDLVFAWEQASGAAAPQQVTVQVAGGSPVTLAVTAAS